MTQKKDNKQPDVRQQKTTPFFFLHDNWDEHLEDTDPNVSVCKTVCHLVISYACWLQGPNREALILIHQKLCPLL